MLRNDYDIWWCSKCEKEWTVRALPHNPNCPMCGAGGWYRRGVNGRPYHFNDAADAIGAETASCSWCHELNPRAERYCWNCGHEAHQPRAACSCRQCQVSFRRAVMKSRRVRR